MRDARAAPAWPLNGLKSMNAADTQCVVDLLAAADGVNWVHVRDELTKMAAGDGVVQWAVARITSMPETGPAVRAHGREEDVEEVIRDGVPEGVDIDVFPALPAAPAAGAPGDAGVCISEG